MNEPLPKVISPRMEARQWELEADLEALSTEQLLALVKRLAHERHDGHWTLLSFTSNYKALWGTPNVSAETHSAFTDLHAYGSLREALLGLLSAEANTVEDCRASVRHFEETHGLTKSVHYP